MILVQYQVSEGTWQWLYTDLKQELSCINLCSVFDNILYDFGKSYFFLQGNITISTEREMWQGLF